MAGKRKPTFTAAASALGYLYQCRYALYLLLVRSTRETDAQIAIEKFDDVSFERNGTPQELIQLKHHLVDQPSLKDTSPDIWKTLRVWSEGASAKTIDPSNTLLTIVTTTKAAKGTAAYYLRDSQFRNPERAYSLLTKAAAQAKGKVLAPARKAFFALSISERRALLDSVHVIDASPDISNIKASIREALGYPVRAEHIHAFQERLEGWWLSRVIERLSGHQTTPISGIDLGRAMDDLRDAFRIDSLPIDFRSFIPPNIDATDDKVFIRQLQLIKLGERRVNWAQVDYYRAFSQRSQWIKDNLVARQQLEEYDDILTEEWQRESDKLEDSARKNDPPSEVIRRGTTLYDHLQDNCRPIRPSCTEPYVGRGSYHMLADRQRVGWHRDFKNLLGSTGEEEDEQ